MKKIFTLFSLLAISLIACTNNNPTDDSKSDQNTLPALTFTHENSREIVKEGEDLYFKENGENVSNRFGFYDNNIYYFTAKDYKGIKFAVSQITENIIFINVPYGSAIWIVEGSDKAAVIDTAIGVGDTKELVELFLKDKPYDVLMTHTHVDHVGGIFAFDTVHTFQADADNAHVSWSVEARMDYANVTDTSGVYTKSDFQEVNEDFTFSIMEEGQIFDLGGLEIQAYNVPGHTNGSALFLIEEDEILISGDDACKTTLLANGNGSVHNRATVETYYNTLKAFKEANEDRYNYILTSHDMGTINPKEGLDWLLESVSGIFEKHKANEAEAELKYSKAVNGWKVSYNTSHIYN